MSVRAVLFDVGGVLEITPRTGWERRWAARLGMDPAAIVGRLGGLWRAGEVGEVTLDEVEAGTAAALGLGPVALRAFMDDLWAEYLGTPNRALIAYVAGLRPRYRTGILSNSFVGARERERAAYDFEALCDVVVYSHEEGLAKPDPRLYALACERLGVAPPEVVFVDDTPACVEGARAAGLRAVAFASTAQAIADVEAHLDGRPSASPASPGARRPPATVRRVAGRPGSARRAGPGRA